MKERTSVDRLHRPSFVRQGIRMSFDVSFWKDPHLTKDPHAYRRRDVFLVPDLLKQSFYSVAQEQKLRLLVNEFINLSQ